MEIFNTMATLLPPEHAKAMAAFDHVQRTRLVFGNGSAGRVGVLSAELGLRRILLVTDPGIVRAGHAAIVQEALESAGLEVVLFDSVIENPTTDCVETCRRVAEQAGIDSFLGLGGGSSMDTAKGANFLLTNGGRMQDYWGIGLAGRQMLPRIVIPTTAGTGSECQSCALISDAVTHAKMACGDPKAMAKAAILESLHTAVTQDAEPVYGVAGGRVDYEMWVALRESAGRQGQWIDIPLTEPTDLEDRIHSEWVRSYGGDPVEDAERLLGARYSRLSAMWTVAGWL